VVVANPRRVRLIAEASSKRDRFDGEALGRLGRIDPNLLAPIVHRGEAAQRDLALIRSRDVAIPWCVRARRVSAGAIEESPPTASALAP
jgi:hypothetical protein